jgi:hypothetical protein
LLIVIFDTIPIQIMLESHQIVLLSVINHSPDKVIDLIAYHYIEPNISKITDVIKTSALAITVALARRIPGEPCYESLARVLWRFIEVKEVVKEFEEQLKNDNSQLRFRVHHVCIKNGSLCYLLLFLFSCVILIFYIVPLFLYYNYFFFSD